MLITFFTLNRYRFIFILIPRADLMNFFLFIYLKKNQDIQNIHFEIHIDYFSIIFYFYTVLNA